MKKLILISAFLVSLCEITFSQVWQTEANLSGAGITKLDVSPVTGTLFASTSSFNYPTGGTGAIYRKPLSSFFYLQVNPEPGEMYVIRTVHCDYRGYVWISAWGDPFTTREKLYLSTNDGANWIKKDSVGTSNNIFCIAVDSVTNNVYMGSRDGVRRSTNSGNTFTLLTSGLPAGEFIRHIEAIGNGLVIVSTFKGIYKSTNHGDSWTVIPGMDSNDSAGAMCIVKSANGDGAGDDRLFATANSGADLKGYTSDFTFAAMALSKVMTGITIFSVEPSAVFNCIRFGSDIYNTEQSCIFVCAYPKGGGNGSVVLSTNGGTNWSIINTGLTSPIQPSAIVYNKFNGFVYCGYFGNFATAARLLKMNFTVGINQLSSEVPEDFSLSQNYPNPFNPTTKIRFEIQKTSEVKLVVYNSLGKEISTLVNQNLNAGTYETDFDGADYNSGVYFYRLFVNGDKSFTETRKMILTK